MKNRKQKKAPMTTTLEKAWTEKGENDRRDFLNKNWSSHLFTNNPP